MAVAILLASCSQTVDFSQHEVKSLYAEIAGDTKTTMGPEGESSRKVFWSKGDRILVSTGTRAKDQAVFCADEGGSSSVSFTIEDADKNIDFEAGYFAVYPVSGMYIGKPDPESEIFINIPSVQNYVPDSFDDDVMPMISDVSYDNKLKFRNIASVLRISLTSDLEDVAVKSILVSSADTISGECGYIPSDDIYFIDQSMAGSNSTALECGDGVAIGKDPIPFNIVVPHRKYSDLSFTVFTVDGQQQEFKLKAGKEIDVRRGAVLNIPLRVSDLEESQTPMVDLEVTSVSYTSFSILLDMQNISSYFCGIDTKSSFERDLESGTLIDVLKYSTPYTAPLSYSGSAVSIQDDLSEYLIEPGGDYVFWVVPFNSLSSYSSDDVVYVEVTTKFFSPGGSATVMIDNLLVDYTSIDMNVISDGGKYTYCMLVNDQFLEDYPTDEDKIHLLLDPGNSSTVYEKVSDTFVRKFLDPATDMIFLAVSVDRSYRYGPLFKRKISTLQLPYCGLSVSINKNLELLRNSGTVNWNVTGGTASSYRFIVKETDSYLWNNTLKSSVVKAQEKMFLEPNIYYISKCSEAETVLSGLVTGKEYILVVTAQDSKGVSSVADSWVFTY